MAARRARSALETQQRETAPLRGDLEAPREKKDDIRYKLDNVC